QLGGAGDAFALKIDAAGRRVVYATYLGGTEDDTGRAVAADAAGNAYVAGVTRSPDLQAAGTALGQADAFVMKLDPRGRSLAYATGLGATGNDVGEGIALDDHRAAYVGGRTDSTDFPIAAGGTPAGGAFVARLARDGAATAFADRLAGHATDAALGLAVDRFG